MARKPNMFNKIFRNKKITALLFVAVFGGVGGAYIMFSKAATVAPRVAMAHWRNYGYWIAASDGQVQNFGKAKFYGSPKKSGLKLAQGITDIAARRDGTGYWLLGGDGGIFAYGGAKYLGKPPASGKTGYYRSIVSTPTGNGYWVVSKYGTGYAFGDAKTTYKIDYSKKNYEVVMGTIKGVDTIVDADHVGGDGKGLFLLDRNGKVYVVGTAKAYYAGGSGTLSSGERASGITADITAGYLITTDKGRVVARGKDVKNVGSMYGKKLGGAITGVQKIGRSSDLSTYGYWLVGRDGGVFAYGKVTYHGAKPVNLTPTTSTTTSTSSSGGSTPSGTTTSSPTCPERGSDAVCVTEVALNLKSSLTGRKVAVNGVFEQADREACLLYRAEVGSYPGVCKNHLEPAYTGGSVSSIENTTNNCAGVVNIYNDLISYKIPIDDRSNALARASSALGWNGEPYKIDSYNKIMTIRGVYDNIFNKAQLTYSVVNGNYLAKGCGTTISNDVISQSRSSADYQKSRTGPEAKKILENWANENKRRACIRYGC